MSDEAGPSHAVDVERPTEQMDIEAAPVPISTTVNILTRLKRAFKGAGSRVASSEEGEFLAKFGLANGNGVAAAPAQAEAAAEETWVQRSLRRCVVEPGGNWVYRWTGLVTLVVLYNVSVIIARAVFNELQNPANAVYWLILDYAGDVVYLFDMAVKARTGFLEQGLLVREDKAMLMNYVRTWGFRLDVLSLVPTDILYAVPSLRNNPVFRLNRLAKLPSASDFTSRTETRTSWPNAFRIMCVILYIIILIHWNACLYFQLCEMMGLHTDRWVYGDANMQTAGGNDSLTRRYVYSFFWSTLTLTTIGETPAPQTDAQFLFVTADFLVGVLVFATIVGNVGSMISNMTASRTDFQNRMDGIKQYMEFRKVSGELQTRVIKWFDYIWSNKQSLSDDDVLGSLPAKLQAEIAMQVHFETLRKVRIFQDCEAGLLAELVLKLQLQVFSPGDYICRKGDIGREMYIVKRGAIAVVSEDGAKVFVTLGEGAVFGELSIMNIPGNKQGNRRSASVRSVGYSDLFALSKDALWDALREYPEAKRILMAKGREILAKDGLLEPGAPDMVETLEERGSSLEALGEALSTRLARLLAQSIGDEKRAAIRFEKLEKALEKKSRVSTKTEKPDKKD